MQTARLTDAAAVAIGEYTTALLREFTEDINQAINDVPAEDKKQAVTIKANIVLKIMDDMILPEINLAFATGKKIKSEAIVNVKQ